MLTRCIYMRKPEKSLSKQVHLQPRCHSKDLQCMVLLFASSHRFPSMAAFEGSQRAVSINYKTLFLNDVNS